MKITKEQIAAVKAVRKAIRPADQGRTVQAVRQAMKNTERA